MSANGDQTQSTLPTSLTPTAASQEASGHFARSRRYLSKLQTRISSGNSARPPSCTPLQVESLNESSRPTG